MPPLSSMTCTCARWKKLPPEDQRRPVWITAHVLHHNFMRKRGTPFTAERLAELAEVTAKEATEVLIEAVRLEWFAVIAAVPARPAAEGQLMGSSGTPAYYISPVKPK